MAPAAAAAAAALTAAEAPPALDAFPFPLLRRVEVDTLSQSGFFSETGSSALERRASSSASAWSDSKWSSPIESGSSLGGGGVVLNVRVGCEWCGGGAADAAPPDVHDGGSIFDAFDAAPFE